ncbi:MAG: hypothetical protein HXS46_01755 [Theionarchaea archaeon]|nr:MAG: hypothetical protein AYK18_03895 [Theionarchaea archaeon DG-70]MBU7009387.1 hypothetical protein [Theionarchaea archaeon]
MNECPSPRLPEKNYVYCPYCYTRNELRIKEGYNTTNTHPPIVRYSEEFPVTPSPFWKFWQIKLPKEAREGSISCKGCGRPFNVGLFPYDQDDRRYAPDLKYYLGVGKKDTPMETKFLLENILDWTSRFFGVKYPFNCFLLIFMFYVLFYMIPIIAFGGFSKLIHDFFFPSLLFLSTLALILLKRHCKMLRKTLNLEKLPLPLCEQYKNSDQGKQYEEALRGFIFGHPYRRVKHPTVCGLVSVSIYSMWHIYTVLKVNTAAYESPFMGYPVYYTSRGGAILSTPWWFLIYFIMGNLAWFIMGTTALVGLVAKHTPLKIDILKEMGGTEIFGEMILSSTYLGVALGVAVPFAAMWHINQQFHVLLIKGMVVMVVVVLILFGFFYPLWPIHKKLKQEKGIRTNRILDRISLASIEGEMNLEETIHTHLLLDVSNRILSMVEWPFKTNTIIKLFSSVFLPFISLIINIMIFT